MTFSGLARLHRIARVDVGFVTHPFYWLGRAQEATGQTARARDSYNTFITQYAGADTPDPTVADARRRAAALP